MRRLLVFLVAMRHLPVRAEPTAPSHSTHVVISCDSCALQASTACADCLVTFVLDQSADATAPPSMDFTDVELHALALLDAAGLVPSLRHREAA